VGGVRGESRLSLCMLIVSMLRSRFAWHWTLYASSKSPTISLTLCQPTRYQALWDLQPDVLYERLGDELQNWMTVVVEVEAARSMVDTQESEFARYFPSSTHESPDENFGQVRVLAEGSVAKVRLPARHQYAEVLRRNLKAEDRLRAIEHRSH